MLRGLRNKPQFNHRVGRVRDSGEVDLIAPSRASECECNVHQGFCGAVRAKHENIAALSGGWVVLCGLSRCRSKNGTVWRVLEYKGAGKYQLADSKGRSILSASEHMTPYIPCAAGCTKLSQHQRRWAAFCASETKIRRMSDVPWPSKAVLRTQLEKEGKDVLHELRRRYHPDKLMQVHGARVASEMRDGVLSRATEIMAFINDASS
eukprot:TRINITY_DN12088_c0_g1_i1.p1 TRINITY_DN12088_c0_g1~~TRINITY_DN12088_c0_g1_i1.p1  ORF type:complete len:207 (-),score=21.41 TRINITY_DN12088_c0_g1_i1:230-850(-)